MGALTRPPPPVSVLLPVRDAVQTIDAAVGSILTQTYEAFELLIVDDGSSDGTRERLAALGADPRVRVLSRGSGPGDLVAALELGRREARGSSILRMDADDVAHPRRLELCLRRLNSDPQLAVVGCLIRSFPEVTLTGGRKRYDAWLNGLRSHDAMFRERFVESPIAHPSALIRTSALERVGGYRGFDGPEDYDLWLRLFAAGLRFAKVPRILHFWRDAPGRLSRVDPRYAAAGMTCARADALAAHLGDRSAAIVGSGAAGRRLARELLARGARVAFFLDVDPRKVGRAPHGVPVLEHFDGMRRRTDELLVSCVNSWGGRARVREWLCDAGLKEGPDFLLAG